MSGREAEALLETLEKAKPPPTRPGAMCYAMAMPASTVEYLCPICGNKTLHADRGSTRLIALELDGCRRLADAITRTGRAKAVLDESALCSACAKPGAAPRLALVLTLADRPSARTEDVSPDDLRILLAFFRGDAFWKTRNDGEQPLKPELPRLRTLLGLR